MGTTSGYVLVYDVEDSYKKTLQVKGHDGTPISMQATSETCYGFLALPMTFFRHLLRTL